MRNKGKYKGSSSKEYKKDMSKVVCHNCKEAGHLKYNCPKLKKEDKGKKEKKKVLMTSWEDLENDSDEEEDSEGEAQICFMVGEDQLDEVNYYDLHIDDLHVIIDDLTLNSAKFLEKYNKYKSEKEMLKAENDFLKEKVIETECALDIIEKTDF
ncbi:zinc finger CCHC-type and RNA-binding motif-containing protein 1-like [Arachis ipaensis]|uniref:zinc finger CCHC-type and RNA-binding motif-containing protein 1-like n=1 Tax=Arachis ipaensis TaxID=130454 RepID=UPI0007AF735E|nr:zinc finger CCHC-type and RNA-binding motif-containing protein 1-like [Arachis ipaensis]